MFYKSTTSVLNNNACLFNMYYFVQKASYNYVVWKSTFYYSSSSYYTMIPYNNTLQNCGFGSASIIVTYFCPRELTPCNLIGRHHLYRGYDFQNEY